MDTSCFLFILIQKIRVWGDCKESTGVKVFAKPGSNSWNQVIPSALPGVIPEQNPEISQEPNSDVVQNPCKCGVYKHQEHLSNFISQI